MDDEFVNKIIKEFNAIRKYIADTKTENKKLVSRVSELEAENKLFKRHIDNLNRSSRLVDRNITQLKDKLSNVDAMAKSTAARIRKQ